MPPNLKLTIPEVFTRARRRHPPYSLAPPTPPHPTPLSHAGPDPDYAAAALAIGREAAAFGARGPARGNNRPSLIVSAPRGQGPPAVAWRPPGAVALPGLR